MEQIITTTVVTLISGAIGAIIGTYGGALFAAKRQEKHIKELRQVAIKALKYSTGMHVINKLMILLLMNSIMH